MRHHEQAVTAAYQYLFVQKKTASNQKVIYTNRYKSQNCSNDIIFQKYKKISIQISNGNIGS